MQEHLTETYYYQSKCRIHEYACRCIYHVKHDFLSPSNFTWSQLRGCSEVFVHIVENSINKIRKYGTMHLDLRVFQRSLNHCNFQFFCTSAQQCSSTFIQFYAYITTTYWRIPNNELVCFVVDICFHFVLLLFFIYDQFGFPDSIDPLPMFLFFFFSFDSFYYILVD